MRTVVVRGHDASMHSLERRQQVLDLLAAGVGRRDVCRRLKVGYETTYRWQRQPIPARSDIRCFRCDDDRPATGYAYLLGMYLGDGHIADVRRSTALRVYCCETYPMIIEEVAAAMKAATGASVNTRQLTGCMQVQSTTRHWRCLFPQHGPGMKHLRPIILEPWQRDIVNMDPRGLIRGLLHSDGCRIDNAITRRLPSGTRTYTYPRYLFSNMSTDIQRIFTDALDQLGIPWRQNRFNSVSIARREGVAALDKFVGPKH